MSKTIQEIDPSVQAIIDAQTRGLESAQRAGATIAPPAAPVAGPTPPPLVQPFLRPIVPQEPRAGAAVPKPPAKIPLPALTHAQRKPKVGDRVLYWLRNPGAKEGAEPVPADVYNAGRPLIEDGKVFDTVNLNVHEPGSIQWADSVPYSAKPRVGCWCWPGDLK